MHNNLLIYRNELKNKIVSNYKMIGIISELILSKVIFKRNADIKSFLSEILFIECKDYIMKSRTMIVAYTIKKIVYNETNIQKKKLIDFINNKIEETRDESISVKKNEFSGWIN